MTDLSKEKWYHGRVSRVDAEKLLDNQGAQEGMYLVRDSLAMTGEYVLSLCSQVHSSWGWFNYLGVVVGPGVVGHLHCICSPNPGKVPGTIIRHQLQYLNIEDLVPLYRGSTVYDCPI